MEGNNIYELAVLLSPDLSEFDVQKVIDKVKASINPKGGVVQKEYTWGKKRLAYPIGKAEFGHYQTLIFDSPKEMIAEIDKDILLMPEIIRHLMISLVKEGVTIAQLFTPEKEEALIATLAKEKMEPSKPHQTRASRGRITPKVETVEAPKILNNPPAGGQDDDAKKTLSVQDDKEIEKAVDVDIIKPVIEETADESAKRRAELDKKLDELLKEE